MAFALFVSPWVFRSFDFFRLLMSYSRFEKAIEAKHKIFPENAVTQIFDWGRSGFLGSNTFYYLVYDETKTIGLDVNARPAGWEKSIPIQLQAAVEDMCELDVRLIAKNYYVAKLDCQ